MRHLYHFKGVVIITVLAVLVVWMAAGIRADDDTMPVVRRDGGVIIHGVGEQKSDMARMVEAYEKLSAQYLLMVQQNLSMMATTDQQIVTKLDALDKKMDELDKKLDIVIAQTAAQTKPEPLPATQ